MSIYDEQYYILFRPSDDQYPIATPDAKTADRPYGYEILSPGPPLTFSNAFKDEMISRRMNEIIGDVIFHSPDILVSERFKDFLSPFDIDGLQLFPSIYIGNDGRWHDNYWFLNFYKTLDCWHRDRSDYKRDKYDPDDNPPIKKYSLHENILDAIPEERRLMFKMGGVSAEYIFAHQLVVDYMVQHAISGVNPIRVADFKEGMQHKI